MIVRLIGLENSILEKTSETEHQKAFKQSSYKTSVEGERRTARKIGEILEMLSDGQWHMLEEIQQRMKLDESQIRQIADFLKEYEFITIDEAKKGIKLEKSVREFLT